MSDIWLEVGLTIYVLIPKILENVMMYVSLHEIGINKKWSNLCSIDETKPNCDSIFWKVQRKEDERDIEKKGNGDR